MSYRAFKRLFGETSLERKCRWLIGSGVLVLMAASFFFYARQTEGLAYDQLAHTGRTLVPSIVARLHVRQNNELIDGMTEFQEMTEKTWPAKLRGYASHVIRPPRGPADTLSADDAAILERFRADPALAEETRPNRAEHEFVYRGAVRAGTSCVACHRDPDKMTEFGGKATVADAELRPGDLMGVASVRLSTEMIESGFHENQAILLAFAVGTTILILAGSYLVIRYVIVKPVKHLKAVADAIAAGQTGVRSKIETADEFEDLSVAFNRMLTNLTNIQERNRGLIATLDVKIDELARANLELFRSNQAKADFLSTMSHELRTPLNSVLGFSENLLRADNLTDRQHRWAANILTGGQQLLALINDVLDLAKMESGRMRVVAEPLDVATLCDGLGALFRADADRKDVELRVQLPTDSPAVSQDAGKLRQILTNLLGNAVKFTPAGGRITLKAAVEGDELTLTVTDTGVGIAPEEQEVVFQKFRQTSHPLTREQGGTGLGLSIVRELAKLLGGDVALDSELGRGSTFTVTVPARLRTER